MSHIFREALVALIPYAIGALVAYTVVVVLVMEIIDRWRK